MKCNFSAYHDKLPFNVQLLYRKRLTLHLDNNEDVFLPNPYACKQLVHDHTKWPDLQFGDIYNFLIFTTGLSSLYLYVLGVLNAR